MARSLTKERASRAKWAAGGATVFVLLAALTSAGLAIGANNSSTSKALDVRMAFADDDSNTGHTEWVPLNTFAWGAVHPATTDGQYTGRASVKEVHLTKPADLTSARFLDSCLTGSQLPDLWVQLTPPTGSGQATVTYVLGSIKITEYGVDGTTGAAQDYDNITLVFHSIKYTYTVGNVTHEDSWEPATNT